MIFLFPLVDVVGVDVTVVNVTDAVVDVNKTLPNLCRLIADADADAVARSER